MCNEIILQDQIRESVRGPRILGELSLDFFPLVNQNPQLGLQPDATKSQMIPIENWEFIPIEDPFALSLKEFLSIGLDEADDLLRKVHTMCKGVLDEAWRRGARQVVICEGKIVLETSEIEDISDETVEVIAKKYDRACYVFSAPDAVEESPWTPVPDEGEDFYPTLCLYLGNQDSDEMDIVKNCAPIYADLDTGNPIYKVFDASLLSGPLTPFTPLQMRQGEHLGKEYTYFTRRMKMCVKDIDDRLKSETYDVRLVKDWKGSALLQASPNRRAFIGRDILRDMRIRLELNPTMKKSRIIEVS